MSDMALSCLACQASSLSSLRLTVWFSSVSSQASAMTVHREPPAHPYRDAFWNLHHTPQHTRATAAPTHSCKFCSQQLMSPAVQSTPIWQTSSENAHLYRALVCNAM